MEARRFSPAGGETRDYAVIAGWPTSRRGDGLFHFNLRFGTQLLGQVGAQLLVFSLLQFGRQIGFYFLEGALPPWCVSIQPDHGVRAFNLDQASDLSGLHAEESFHNLWWEFVPAHGFVIAHVHPEIIFGDLFRQHSKVLVRLGSLCLVEGILGFLLRFFGLSGSRLERRHDRDALEAECFRILEARRILRVIRLHLGWRYGGLGFYVAVQHLLDEQGTPNLLPQALLGPAHLRLQILLVLVRTGELLLELGHRAA